MRETNVAEARVLCGYRRGKIVCGQERDHPIHNGGHTYTPMNVIPARRATKEGPSR